MAVRPATANHAAYMRALDTATVTVCAGTAGTGKTYMAVYMAVQALRSGAVGRIVVTRPIVEAGESLGFLPGDLGEKVQPYMAPIFAALKEFMTPAEYLEAIGKGGTVEVAPLAYLRGSTFRDAFMILDEAQNSSVKQVVLFLTRAGKGTRVVVAGDLEQSDLPDDSRNGLGACIQRLGGLPEVAIVHMGPEDVMRSPWLAKVLGRLAPAPSVPLYDEPGLGRLPGYDDLDEMDPSDEYNPYLRRGDAELL